MDEVYDALNMKGNDGFLPFIGFEECEVGMGIHEEVLREYCGADGVFEDVEGGLEVGVAIGPVGADLTSREVSLGGAVQAVGQLVRKGVPVVGVNAPAGGFVPAVAFTCGIDVDADKDGVGNRMAWAACLAIGPADTLREGDVFLFRNEKLGFVAPVLEVLHDGSGYLTVVFVLPETSVRRALARGFNPVAIVNKDYHL